MTDDRVDKVMASVEQRLQKAERQVSEVLAETRQDIQKALREILQGASGNGPKPPDTTIEVAGPKTDKAAEMLSTTESNPQLASVMVAEQELDNPPSDGPRHSASIGEMLQGLETAEDRHAALSEKETDLMEIAHDTANTLGISGDDVMRAFRCFAKYDSDNSGKVSTSELEVLLSELSGEPVEKADVEKILKKFDKNDDGELDFEEFLYCYCYTPAKKMDHLKAAVYSSDDKLDMRFRTRMVGVVADRLKTYLRKEMDEEAAFLQIPVIFLLFLFFCIAVSLHRPSFLMQSVEKAVEFDIVENANFAFVGVAPFENGRMGHKGIHDVNSFADFWSWLDLGLAPLFFPSGWSTSEVRSNIGARCVSPSDAMSGAGFSKAQANASYAAMSGDLGPNLCNQDAGTAFPTILKALNPFADDTKAPYLFFNEIVAGIRLEQELLPKVECSHSDFFNHAYTTPCIEVNEEAWLHPDAETALHKRDDLVNRPGGETVYFRSGMDLGDVHREIRTLEDRRWVNPATGRIQITYAFYNNQIDMFVAVYINFYISRAGHIHKFIKPVSMAMSPYGNPACYVVDIIFALLVSQLFVAEARQLGLTLYEMGLKSGFKSYFNDFKNIVDWASLSYSAVVFVMWAMWILRISELGDLLLTANPTIKGSWESGGKNDILTSSNPAFWQAVDETAIYDERMQYVLAFYPICIGLRFFSAFSAQPRLGMVTATLKCAANDLIHFGVVMCMTLLVFTASGLILFGREVEEFENFGRTFVSIIRGLLTAEFDYTALTDCGRFAANVWWSLFLLLTHCVMLNMVLAIIMDVYASVKGGMGDEDDFPTLWSQSYEVWGRWRKKRQGLRLSIEAIVRALDEHERDEFVITKNEDGQEVRKPLLINVHKFMKIVPGLGKGQAERLLGNARHYYERLSMPDPNLGDCLSGLRGVDLKVQHVDALTSLIEQQSLMMGKALASLSTVSGATSPRISSRIVRAVV